MIPFTQSLAGVVALYQSLSGDQKKLLDTVCMSGIFPTLTKTLNMDPQVATTLSNDALPIEQRIMLCATQVPVVRNLLEGKKPEPKAEVASVLVNHTCPSCNYSYFGEVNHG